MTRDGATDPARFEGLLDVLPDFVFQVSGDGSVLAARLGPPGDPAREATAAAMVGAHVSDVLDADAARTVLEAIHAALVTGEAVSCAWKSGARSPDNRTYREGVFTKTGRDRVLVISRDVTAERCRSEAERFLVTVGRDLISTDIPQLEAGIEDALRRLAAFVDARGALLLLPINEAGGDFSIAATWAPLGMPPETPSPPGEGNWLGRYLAGLDTPVILNVAEIPDEATVVRWVATQNGLAAIGLIPLITDRPRIGAVAVGFPDAPGLVARQRFASLASFGHLLAAARERGEREATRWIEEAERRFRAHASESPDMILVVALDGTLRVVSPSVEHLLGYRPEELVGRSAFELLHPLEQARSLAAFEELGAKGGRGESSVLRVRHRDGSWRTFESIITDQRDDVTVGGYVAVARDVTDQVAAEDALRASEQRFRELAERASDIIYRFALAPEPRLEYISPASRSLTGFDPEEIYADPSLMLGRIHPDDRDPALAQFAEPRAATRSFSMRWQHRDGRWVWTEHRLVPILDDAHHLVAVEGVARDVTEQMRAEAQLRGSNALSRSVLESIPGPTVVVDASGIILMTNEAWTSYAGAAVNATSDAVGVGQSYTDFCDDAASRGLDGTAELAAGVRAVLGGQMGTFRVDCPALGSSAVEWFAVRVSPLRSEGGGAVVLHTDISDRKRYEAELQHQALHDVLTGVPNRALLADRLAGAIARAGRHALSVAVLVVDLDRFKVVNDSLGHAAGDDVLVKIGARLRAAIRTDDTVARLGGDEFAILAEGVTSRGDAAQVAANVLLALEKPLDPHSGLLTVTASIGIALGNRSSDPETLLGEADAAMYHAKELGRNRYEFFNRGLRSDDALNRLLLESELRNAAEKGQLRLLYQPVVDLETGMVLGAEALVRWQHPRRGLLAPGEFLPFAEDTGAIYDIGSWVLHEACRQQRAWLEEHPQLQPFEVAVNVSPRQLRRLSFVDEVADVIRETGADRGQLSLELTETALMEEAAARTAEALHDAGVRLAVDDFGIGYSSLSYLKRFPVSTVKIDKSFVGGVTDDPEDAAIVRGIIGMTDALGLGVIAEGVERIDQRDRLLALGCGHGQGFLYARPMSAAELTPILQRATIQPTARSGRVGLRHDRRFWSRSDLASRHR